MNTSSELDELLASVDAHAADNPVLVDAAKALQLFGRLLSREDSRKSDQILRELRALFENDFLELVGSDLVSGDGGLILAFEQTLDRLTEALAFPPLETKYIFAVGGGFSAGKSSFINTLVNSNQDLLPTDTRPTTSIPALICRHSEQVIGTVNQFDKWIPMERDELQAISHEFHDRYQVGFSGLLKYVVIGDPDFPFDNAALLDTPGYSKADPKQEDSGEDDDHSDRTLAQRQLESADHVLWLVDIKQGTLSQADIDFLLSLRNQPSLFVIVTKADSMTPEQVKEVVPIIEGQLKDKNLNVEGVIPYSAHEPERYPLDSLETFIKGKSSTPKSSNFWARFNDIFEQYRALHEKEIDEGRQILEVLNRYALMTGSDEEGMRDTRPDRLAGQQRKRIRQIKELESRLTDIEAAVMAHVGKAREIFEHHRRETIKRMSAEQLQKGYIAQKKAGDADADLLLVDGALKGDSGLMKQLLLRLTFPKILAPLSEKALGYLHRRLDRWRKGEELEIPFSTEILNRLDRLVVAVI